MDKLFKLLEDLEELVEQSKPIPFSSKVSVSKEEIFEIITDLRLRIPNDIKQAKWVLDERQKILVDAEAEAQEIIKSGEERFAKMVDEHEITKQAYEQAAMIVDEGKALAKEMRLGAIEYVERILAQLEQGMQESVDLFEKQIEMNQRFFSDTLDIINENREELRAASTGRSQQE